MSSLHAFVTEVGNDFVLNDNGSKNGIRQTGDRVPTVILKAGSTFQIGKTDFAVVGDAADVELPPDTGSGMVPSSPTIASPPANDEVAAPKPAEKTLFRVAEQPLDEAPTGGDPAPEEASAINAKPDAARRWNDVLAEITIGALGNIKDQPRAVVALTPAVKLTFIGGVQAETRWILGYGPRRAGAASIDLPIFESGAPDVCFEIIPSPEGVTFRTNHPKEVTLNGEQLRVQSLQEGDMIAIGQTRIEVEFER